MFKHLVFLGNELNSITSDYDKFRFILEHNGIFSLMLDNDCTSIVYSISSLNAFGNKQIKALPSLNNFSCCIGNDFGVFILLKAVGIDANGV